MKETIFPILGFIILISLAIFFIWVVIKGYKRELKMKRNICAKEEERRMKKQQVLDTDHKRFVEGLTELTNKYGPITRKISYELYDNKFIKQYIDIVIFEQAKKIMFGNIEYNFEDIHSCSLYDENKKDVPAIQVTRTNTGSMLGRAAVGALTFGVAGAVVGAVTANKESINTSDTNYFGSYIVKVGVKSIEKPLITLQFGNDKSKAEEVYATMQAIIAMK